jgi:hypothetical protein
LLKKGIPGFDKAQHERKMVGDFKRLFVCREQRVED